MGAPQPVPPYAPQPVQKSKAGPIIIIIAVIALLACLGCGGFAAYTFWWAGERVEDAIEAIPTDFPTLAPDGNETGPHAVKYEVNGTGKMTVTWARGTGGTDSETVDLPWSKEITVTRDNFGVSVTGYSPDTGPVDADCAISVDGSERVREQAANDTLFCAYTYVSG